VNKDYQFFDGGKSRWDHGLKGTEQPTEGRVLSDNARLNLSCLWNEESVAHNERELKGQIAGLCVPLTEVHIQIWTLKKETHVNHLQKIKITWDKWDNERVIWACKNVER